MHLHLINTQPILNKLTIGIKEGSGVIGVYLKFKGPT